ncbi:LuxR C-terminal-related transcriptional regulator [Kibdelosporangium lantanae]|uniref:LuxR C-terminal-related transcriptional regulator n=1 Tax=Kibdelosporangium lantanae TaxID=1497396 RepID=A0ABW3M764_9PSEU
MDETIMWRNRFLALLDRTPLPTAICSLNGMIAITNPAMATLFHTRPSRLRNRRVTDLLTPVVPGDYQRLVRNLSSGRRTTQKLAVHWSGSTGQLTVQAVGDPDGTGLLITLQADPLRPRLSEREAEIVRLVASGETSAAIASRLGITPDGVNYHLRKLTARFAVPNRAALVSLGLGTGSSAGSISA